MRKMNNRETFRFLFKLIILFQLYSYLKFTAEATQLSHTKKNVGQFDKTDGNNLNDRMSQIEAKSQRQEKELSLLKTTVVEDKRIIRQLRGRVSSLESLMLTSISETNEKPLLRSKRPYRLLPVSGERRDKIEKKKPLDIRFYGPARNCNELGRLGYTLNGYYLVKGTDESIDNSIEAVLCQFQLPEESREGTNEKRLGLVKFGKNEEESQEQSKEKLIELTDNNQLKSDRNELKATERNPIGVISSISSIDITTTAKPTGWGVAYGPTSPRRAYLINGFGKCAISGNSSRNDGLYMHQWDCNSVKDNPKASWSWNEVSLGSRDRHICNGKGMCVATEANKDYGGHQVAFYHLDENGQRFNFVDSLTHPGFYVIKNDHGKCLSVPENKGRDGAPVWACNCNSSEAGQRWKWL